MGMDLVALRGATILDDDLDALEDPSPQNGEAVVHLGPSGFHANWTWWSVLLGMLDRLGADLTQASGSNDGQVVDEKTAVAWADLVEEAMSRLVLVQLEHDDNNPYLNTIHIVPTQDYDLLELARVPQATISMVSDLENTRAYLEEFILFLRTCGGFAQY